MVISLITGIIRSQLIANKNKADNTTLRRYTHSASVLLFLVFGLKLLKDAREMDREGPSEELEEVIRGW